MDELAQLSRSHATEIAKHPEWTSVMEKAFRAKHFNDYQNGAV